MIKCRLFSVSKQIVIVFSINVHYEARIEHILYSRTAEPFFNWRGLRMSVGAPLPLKILFLIRKIVDMRLHTETNGNVVLEKPSLRFSGVDEAKATKNIFTRLVGKISPPSLVIKKISGNLNICFYLTTVRDLFGRKPSVLWPFLLLEAEILSSGINSSFLSKSWSWWSVGLLEVNNGAPSKLSYSVFDLTTIDDSVSMGAGVGRNDCVARISSAVFLSSEERGPYMVPMSGIPFSVSHRWYANWLSCLPSARRIRLSLCNSSSICLAFCSLSSFSFKYCCLSKYHCWLAKMRAHSLWPHTRAKDIGVWPFPSTALIVAPDLINSCRHLTWPSLAAWCTGVIPALVGLK